MIEVLDDNNNLFDITTTHVLHGTHDHVYIDDKGDCKRLNIVYMNIQSLLNILYDVEILIHSLKYVAHIIILSETWLRENDGPHFNIPGYRAYHSIRIGKESGGVSIFVENTVDAVQLLEEDFDDSNYLVIKLLKYNINVMGIYRGHDTDLSEFNVRLDKILHSYPKSILCGDINLNLLDKDTNNIVSKYVETVSTNGFLFLNKIDKEFSTRVTNTTSTIIDHAVSDLSYEFEFNLVEKYLSDHRSIVLSMSINNISSPPILVKMVTDYETISEAPLWGLLKNESDFDEVIRKLSVLVKNNTKNISLNTKRKRKGWVSNELLGLIDKRERYFRMMKKDPNNSYIIDQYNKYKRMATAENIKLKKKYNSKEFGDCNDSRNFWRSVKRILYNRNINHVVRPSLIIGKDVISDELKLSNIFNKFFITIGENITQALTKPSLTDFDYIRYNITVPFKFTRVYEEEVTQHIQNLNLSASTGIDGISAKFIIKFSDKLASVYENCINYAIINNKFPNSLKFGKVVPIPKSGNYLLLNNNRPISILNASSKIFESVVLDRLNTFLSINNVISDSQFGFRKNSSTTAAVLGFINFVNSAFIKKHYVGCIFVDIKKAFDTVDHDLLLMKLKKLGFSQDQLDFFMDYLTNREQVVQVGRTVSDVMKITKGVPQGSILGPTLFNIFINDITKINLVGNLILYADDAVICYENENLNSMHSDMESDLVKIKRWFDLNLLILNAEKTKLLLFGNKNIKFEEKMSFTLFYDNQPIEHVTEFTYLGVIIDNLLNWKKHVDKVKSSISPYIFVIKRVRNFVPFKCLLAIYNSYIMSRILYVLPIWSNCVKYKLDELLILQKRALKYMCHLPFKYPSMLLFQNFRSLNLLIEIEKLILMYKLTNNLIMHDLDFQQIRSRHNHGTRRISHYLIAPNMDKNLNILCSSLSQFNSLPREIKYSNNVITFKKSLIEFFKQPKNRVNNSKT